VGAATSLSAADLRQIDIQLAATDTLLDTHYPGDDGSRQPVHTVYVPADLFTPDLAAEWGEQALDWASPWCGPKPGSGGSASNA